MDERLQSRLQAIGVDARHVDDPHQAWLLLYARYGKRATLIDRYELEAASRGVPVESLPGEVRARLSVEVLGVRYPGIELLGSMSGQPVDVVPYEAQWPLLFAEWRARLSEALGADVRRIEHIGSTAVSGLAAKPIIDIQISVVDADDEDAYRPGIESTGVALRMREPRHRYFRPLPDRPRVVQIHVCTAGQGWERDHLLFRDYLRAHPGVRDAYSALKTDLANRYRADRLAYNEAKTGFILDVMDDANDWAIATLWSIRPTSPS